VFVDSKTVTCWVPNSREVARLQVTLLTDDDYLIENTELYF
jgi:hypothetical protein